jgi:TRAP-type uncharacterized transport system substrate-binding protein
MLNNCNTELVNLTNSEISNFISLAPEDFKKAAIAKNIYTNNPQKISTCATQAVLTASAKLLASGAAYKCFCTKF